MTALKGKKPPASASGEVGHDDTLESVIALSGGDTTRDFVVTHNGEMVGTLDMKVLVKALVPRIASQPGARANH